MSHFMTMGDDVLGDDVLGEDFDVVGAPRLVRRGRPRRKASWRKRLAPGVMPHGEGLQPLPLTPDVNNGVFTAAIHAISFTARPQVPFRPERLIATVRRSGAAGTIILATTMFCGRYLQFVETGRLDIEQFSATAFGVRLSLDQVEPGQLIRIDCIDNPAVGGADTVAVSLSFLGRSLR